MTTETLIAGPELDAEIARRVFGIEKVCLTPWSHICNGEHPKEYSTDIACAWLVVEKMGELGWHHFDLEKYLPGEPPEYKWIALFGSSHHRDKYGFQEGRGPVCIEADTAPLAICSVALAALEAHG